MNKPRESGISLCRWTKRRLNNGRNCYKSIYGVDSHRCLQMSPVPDFCNFSCRFCWRVFGKDRFKAGKEFEKAEELVDRMIASQRKLLSGFGGNPNTTSELLKEGMNPAHFAISLDGEPTLYPYLAELIEEVKKRGMSVFLVTNGTMPSRLKELLDKKAIPDNLSISVYATNAGDYDKIVNPFIKNSFERVIESLKLMREFENCRTNFRMTLVKDLNLGDSAGYAKLIKIGNPRFITIKGYSHLGASQKRLKKENMPSMKELENFAEEIVKETGYIVKLRDEVSLVVILVRDENVWEWNKEKIKEQKERFKNYLRL